MEYLIRPVYDQRVVSISHERPVESERRLLTVLRAAEVVHLDGIWTFQRYVDQAPPEAVATVRDDEGWCALVPAASGPGERFGLTRTTFPAGIDNSGFVGWLTTTIKRRLGSGVFVVCGDNPGRGGIFDYLGYPIRIADDVRGLIDDLRSQPAGDPLDLDLHVFEVVETSPTSAISADTVFEFREQDGVVEAAYMGGAVVRGLLTGRRDGDRVQSVYAQLHGDGQLRSGTNDMRLQRTVAGRLRLVEEFRWSDGRSGRNVLQSLEPADDR
jgi:hypothetical protein